MNNFWSIRTIIVCAFSVSMFFLGLAGPRDAYAERKDSVGGFMSNESFYAQERKLDSLYLTSNLEEYKAAAIAATDKSGIGVFMRNKTNFKQQIQRLLKTAATVATVVRQLP